MAGNVTTKERNLHEFLAEGILYTFEPNFRGARCWLTLEDVPDKMKSRVFSFETLGNTKRYMTPVQKDGRHYAKIYIVENKENIVIIYVEKHAVCQGERYYHK